MPASTLPINWIKGPLCLQVERPPTKGRTQKARASWREVRGLWSSMKLHSSKGSAESTADYGGSEEQLHFHPLVKDAGVLNLGCYRNTKRRGCRGLVKLTSPVELTMLRAVLSSIVTM